MWDATASEGLTYNVIDADGHVLEPLICGGVQRTSIDASRSCMWARGRGPKTRYNSSPACSQIPRGEMSDNMTMAEWAAMLWQLIFADDPAEIARLKLCSKARRPKLSMNSLNNRTGARTFRSLLVARVRQPSAARHCAPPTEHRT